MSRYRPTVFSALLGTAIALLVAHGCSLVNEYGELPTPGGGAQPVGGAGGSAGGVGGLAGTGGSGATSSGGAGGEAPACTEETAAEICNDDNACTTEVCSEGECGNLPIAAGPAPLQSQVVGDCQRITCIDGQEQPVVDDADLPDDGNDCTEDACAAGVVSNPALPLGTPCDQDGGQLCNGDAVAAACVECNAASDCTGLPPNSACSARACETGTCVMQPVPSGTPLETQTPGDCYALVCDGQGGEQSIIDDDDLPDDQNACTDDVCTAGVPSNPSAAEGTACGTGLSCNAIGQCTGCDDPADCGQDTSCVWWNCVTATCVQNYEPDGTPLPPAEQIAHDCKERQCNAIGGVKLVGLAADLPLDDGNECTAEACSGGAELHPPLPVDAECSQGGGIVCDGIGECVACNNPTQCPPATVVCTERACSSNDCVVVNVANGTPAPGDQQVAGDCLRVVCDGAGSSYTVAQDSDVPADDNECTNDVCTSGTPSNPPLDPGTDCTAHPDWICNGSVTEPACVQCIANSYCTAPDTCDLDTWLCTCVPQTCANLGLTCGPGDDGCFGSIDCDDNQRNGSETDLDCGGNVATCPTRCGQNDDCANDSDCQSTLYCPSSTHVCTPKIVNGQSCTNGSQCQSTFCVDGVCCGTACGGLCQACTAALTGGTNGTCSSISVGTDPDGECAASERCNGAGLCKEVNGTTCAAGTECLSGNCVDGVCCGAADCPGDCSVCNAPGSLGSCASAPSGSVCSDGLYCNGNDTCDSGGSCAVHVGNPCPGADGDSNCAESCNEAADNCTANDPTGSSCSDGLYCNGADSCNAGACSNHVGSPCPGPDGDSNCAESCNETSDNCTATDPNGSACSDGTYCNGTETCTGGTCGGSPGNPCPGADGDGNCAESCNETSDNCTLADPNGSACTDGTYCNGADTCSAGACTTHVGNPCPGADGDGNCAESCNETSDNCTLADPNGSSCNDGTYCNGADTCSGGACSVHGSNPCPGADGDSNCAESCNETSDNCTLADPNGSACNDGAYCNGADTCSGGACGIHAGDPCSAYVGDNDSDCSESCSEASDNCTANDPSNSFCNDGAYCTTTDRCNTTGSCIGTGNPCPGADGDSNCSESCNEGSDNCTLADPNGSSCDDGTYCNGMDTCSGGSCSSHTGDPCPGADGDGNCAESCYEGGENCTAEDYDGASCTDGTFCNGTDSCFDGSCANHSGNPCPGQNIGPACDDSCNEGADNCTYPDTSGTGCDDGQYCTVTDACDGGGSCLGNGDPCTGVDWDEDCRESCNEAGDSCDGDDPEGAPCEGYDRCWHGDWCSGGWCYDGSTYGGDGSDCFNWANPDCPDTCCWGSCQDTDGYCSQPGYGYCY